ncbi:unnamed protein product [Rhizoctonia solani]|uniref:Uncharacterized protein n=1 Tax=Rhizoctonia solani TaxID=456999 RepID=A0A8H3CQ79_9AGAM|nr:unnamed protein product [Rhizoctonia solani]
MWLSDGQKIGVGLTSFGVFFMFLGVMLFFDGGLLALGNILFVSGLTLIIGPTKTFYFFARKQKLRGTICFVTGILLVFFKWPFVGMIIETFGFLNLFGQVDYIIYIFLLTIMQGFLPGHRFVPAPITFHRDFPELTVH